MTSDPYDDLTPLFGDMHNHCGISYGYGSLEDALSNAREQLDFVSITGHAHWPDMPEPDPRIQYIIDFHEEGFARLRQVWGEMMETLRERNEEGKFVVFPGFEVHSCESGDRNMLYKDLDGEILYPQNIGDLHDRLQVLRDAGKDSIAQPHHVGYRTGTRGIDWDTFDPRFAPFVEMLSMHGCSEGSENTRPFLHSMGPSDYESTIAAGLEKGHLFGFSGGTDHHSGHPGSYGHGRTAVWAGKGTRESIWKALYARRMYALTGDRMELKVTVNDAPMGAVIQVTEERRIEFDLAAGGAIDAVDILKNGKLEKRFSQPDFPAPERGETVRTKIHLELGWGAKHRSAEWQVEFGVEGGRVISVEPRFRGLEVVSPAERNTEAGESFYRSRVIAKTERAVSFETVSNGNATNSTSATQGMCIEVEMPVDAVVYAVMNGVRAEHTLSELMRGARSGSLDHTDAPSWRFNRAPKPEELSWRGAWIDEDHSGDESNYYVRVRQRNDQWAWSSPVFLRKEL